MKTNASSSSSTVKIDKVAKGRVEKTPKSKNEGNLNAEKVALHHQTTEKDASLADTVCVNTSTEVHKKTENVLNTSIDMSLENKNTEKPETMILSTENKNTQKPLEPTHLSLEKKNTQKPSETIILSPENENTQAQADANETIDLCSSDNYTDDEEEKIADDKIIDGGVILDDSVQEVVFI